jgi:hypothetical protein
MIWQILFVIFGWLYFYFEGKTEGIGTKDNPNLNATEQQDDYHIKRILENAGIAGAISVIMIAAKFWLWIPLYILVCISGLGLYEMSFNKEKYGDPLYDKSSIWLGIPHPKGIIFKRMFIFGGIATAIWIIVLTII